MFIQCNSTFRSYLDLHFRYLLRSCNGVHFGQSFVYESILKKTYPCLVTITFWSLDFILPRPTVYTHVHHNKCVKMWIYSSSSQEKTSLSTSSTVKFVVNERSSQDVLPLMNKFITTENFYINQFYCQVCCK